GNVATKPSAVISSRREPCRRWGPAPCTAARPGGRAQRTGRRRGPSGGCWRSGSWSSSTAVATWGSCRRHRRRQAGGRVVGVIPQFLKDLEREHKGCTELQVVPDMRTRKLQMLERGDAFVALPGGVGTLEELLEVLEWTVSGRHDKPLGLLNLDGLYDPLLELLRGAVQERFEAPDLLDRLVVASCPEELLAGLEAAAAAAGACREKLAAPRAPAAAALPLASQPELEGASATAVLADSQEPAGGGGAEDFRAAAERLGRLLAEEGAAVALGGSAACPGNRRRGAKISLAKD
ncbi:unnamed protein product, partial [Prorocentrum cordatum]